MHVFNSSLALRALTVACVSVFALLSTEAAHARKEKVDLCHLQGNGDHHLINVAAPALRAHLRHGDSYPGDIVPGSEGQLSFDEDCSLIPACPCAVDLPTGWLVDIGASGISVDDCGDGVLAERTFTTVSDTVNGGSLSYNKTEQCDGPTFFDCAAGGNTREISEAQFEACRALRSLP